MNTNLLSAPFVSDLAVRALDPQPSRSVFYDLFEGSASESELEHASHYLCGQLTTAAAVDSDLPENQDELLAWMEANVEQVGQQYHEYLEARHAGAPRRFFRNKSHALYFLRSVAPTKMVDGAWLYGLLQHHQDPRFASLIQTYLEELGEGEPSKNHVVLYKKLLASQGCERWDDLRDEHYEQGAIQLALAYHAEKFLPEIIGYNLGYEQLPLHLLITAYELKELRIDPYYFTLHVTVDNADSGHARKAVDAISEAMPRVGDAAEWYRRVRNGYNLNYLGANTSSVIESFDLEQEMISTFQRKAVFGQYAHSDGRRVEGRTVNDWLSNSEQTAEFLAAMENEGWFARHQDPQNSRFWRLIHSEKAKMFGVFSGYEQQIIYDWILGDAAVEYTDAKSIRPRHHERPVSASQPVKVQTGANFGAAESDFDAEQNDFKRELAAAKNPQEKMTMVIELMSPATHHSTAGLAATRAFTRMFL